MSQPIIISNTPGPSIIISSEGNQLGIVKPFTWRYYRLYITATVSATDWMGVLELELMESVGGANIAVGNVTGLASRQDAPASLAFDGLYGSLQGWNYNFLDVYPQWLRADFGEGKGRNIVQYKVGSYITTNNTAGRSIRDWLFQRSNDAMNWETIDSVTNETGWTFGESRTFII
jgi:hypothetical protein